jgi:hypothetical protein
MKTVEQIVSELLENHALDTIRSVLVFAGINQPNTVKDVPNSLEIAINNIEEIFKRDNRDFSLDAMLKLAEVYQVIGFTYLNNIDKKEELLAPKFYGKKCNLPVEEKISVYFVYKNDETIKDVIRHVDNYFLSVNDKALKFVKAFGLPVFNFDKDMVYIPKDKGICLDWRGAKANRPQLEEKILDEGFLFFRGYRGNPISTKSDLFHFLYTFYKEFMGQEHIDLIDFIKRGNYKLTAHKHIVGVINCTTAKAYRFRNPQVLGLKDAKPKEQIDALTDEFGRVLSKYDYLEKNDFTSKLSELESEYRRYLITLEAQGIISERVSDRALKLI